MNESEKNGAVSGGSVVRVKLLDGREEEVTVKQLPLKDYEKLRKLLDDEIGMVSIYCGKERSWTEGLTVESHEALIEEAEKVNAGFFRWFGRLFSRGDRLRPGLLEKAMAGSLPTGSPTRPPSAG